MIIDLVDKLADRIIELLTYKQKKRKELLEEYVIPLFEEFERVHSAYLESFSRYREQIINAPSSNWIPALQAVLRRDNLFSASTRSKISRIAQAGFLEINDPFVGGVCDYVTDIRIFNPAHRSDEPQRWRNSFSDALYGVAIDEWDFVIHAFNLRKNKVALKAEEISAMYQFSRKVGKKDAVRRAFALYALDSIVARMQKQYDKVCLAYTKLRKDLST